MTPYRRWTVLGTALILAPWTAPVQAGAPPGGSRAEGPRCTERWAGAGFAAASRAFKEPVSGGWTAPPAGAGEAALGPPPAALATSAAGLAEEPGPEARGGVRVELAGRFRSVVVARKTADGRLAVGCAPAEGPAAARSPEER